MIAQHSLLITNASVWKWNQYNSSFKTLRGMPGFEIQKGVNIEVINGIINDTRYNCLYCIYLIV